MQSDTVSPYMAGDPSASREIIEDLSSQIIGLAGRLAAATCRWLLLIADFDEKGGAGHYGLGSTARWVSHYCGLSRRTAVEHVRVARALARFPELAAGMAAGRLSYSHVRAISRLARDDEPALVSELITVAEYGTVGQLETMVRGLRTVDLNELPRRETPEASLSRRYDDHSQWRLAAHLPPEDGAIIQSALERLAREDGISEAQALVRMAEIVVAALNDGQPAPRTLRGEERAAVVIHLDAAAIPPEAAKPDATTSDATTSNARTSDATTRAPVPYARIQGGPGLPDRVVRRLVCAGRVRLAVHGPDGNVQDLGRSHRMVSDRQFRMLLLRDGGCAHPGCGSKSGLEAHHVRHWVDGGATDLANLVLLCRAHHHAHHDQEFAIQALGGGHFAFIRDGDRALPASVDPSAFIDTVTAVEAEHADVAATAAQTRWGGERLDRHWAIAVLADRRRRESERVRLAPTRRSHEMAPVPSAGGTPGSRHDRSANRREVRRGRPHRWHQAPPTNN
ncbi:HNH endonuclease [Frankineae bacterium MT45]|nr:HNH endonuclease [Frankineae bacterium MT45]